MFFATESDPPAAPNATPIPGAERVPIGSVESANASGRPYDAWYDEIIQVIPVAACLCDSAGHVLACNRRAVEIVGRAPDRAASQDIVAWLRPVAGASFDGKDGATVLTEIVREDRARTEMELPIEATAGTPVTVRITVHPLRDLGGRTVMVVMGETSGRRPGDRHAALLGRLSEELAFADSEAEIVRIATRLVGEHLGVQRCGFVENEGGAGTVRALTGWMREPLPSLAGRHELQALGSMDWQHALKSARVAIDDVTTHPHTRQFSAYYEARRVGSYAGAPFVRLGTWAATLTVTQETPRHWTDDELSLLEHVVARVWPLVEKARTQATLQLISAYAPVVLAYFDRESRIVFANRAFAARWGLAPEALTGKRLADVIGAEAFELLRPHVEKVLEGKRVEIEVDVPYREIGSRYVRIACSPDRDSEGNVRGYLSAVSDLTDRRDIEHALRESEERFRTLAEHAPVGIFQVNRGGDCVFVNEQWCRMAGIAAADARTDGWLQAVHPDDRSRIELEWRTARERGTAFACECRYLRSDGVVTWVQCGVVDYRDDSGRPVGQIGTVVDITERKAAEFALRESEKRFRLVASRAPVGIFMTDPRGETVFVNASWCGMAGLSAAEAQGTGWARAIHPDDRENVAANWNSAVRTGTSSKAEFRFLRPDGTVTWVHGVAVQLRDANGRLTGYIGTVADFTERKQAEMALRESEERFRMLADNIMQFAWICDPAGRYVWVNRRFLDYGGLSIEEMNEGRAMELQHPDHLGRVREKFRQHLASGEPWEDSFPLRSRDGSYRWFLSRATPIRDDGRITRWFGTNTDITDWRETQEMLRKAQEELLAHAGDLERKIESRTASLRDAIVQMEEFSYSVSHDLRAPLRAMNGYAEALVEDYGAQLDDTAREYLDRIQRSSLRMEKLTHDVLTYSRLARADLILSPIDLEAVVRDLVGQYAELQPGAADLVIDHPLLPVRGHELSLGQCLANLLTNAAKFIEPGVRPRIRISTSEVGEAIRVSVADNGIGIRPEHQERLFQVFERVPTPTTYEGTGIGLAIVRKAVEKMGGRYGVVSDGRSGSCFWIELPKP